MVVFGNPGQGGQVSFSGKFAIMHVCLGFQDNYVISPRVNSIHCHIDQHLDFNGLDMLAVAICK